MISCQDATWINGCLTLLKEILHPERKLEDIEFTLGKPGRHREGDLPNGSFTQASDSKEI